MSRSSGSHFPLFTAVAAVVAIIGVFLPWATASLGGVSISSAGIDAGGGKVILVVAAIAAVMAFLTHQGKGSKGLLLAAGLLLAVGALVAVLNFFDPDFDKMGDLVSRGIGLFASAAGTVAGAVLAFLSMKGR